MKYHNPYKNYWLILIALILGALTLDGVSLFNAIR